MRAYSMDPRKQFSKKLAGRAEWFWMFYMTLVAALAGYRPEAYVAAIVLASLVTVVMVTSVLAYTNNSMYEKGLYAPNQIAKAVKLNWKEAFSFSKGNDQTEETQENDESEQDGGEG